MSSLLYINKKNCLWPREESCLARWELNLCHVPILSVHLPCLLYVEDKYGRLTFFFFFRAMVLNRDPKVKSPWFETRSGKNSATSQLLGSSARKFRRWSFTCVSEEVNWTPFCNELCFLNPFAQLLDCRSIVVFFNLPIGVSARNHGTWRSPRKMMIFWVRGPAPFFNCSNFFFVTPHPCWSLSSSARVGEILSQYWGVIVVSHHSHSLWDPIEPGSNAGWEPDGTLSIYW